MKSYWTYLAVCAAGAVAFAVLQPTLSPQGEGSSEVMDSVPTRDQVREQVASLSKTVGELQARLAIRESLDRHRSHGEATLGRREPVPTVAMEEAPEVWDEADGERMQEDRRAQADGWYSQQEALLEQSFSGQGADPVWEAETQERILTAFEGVREHMDLVSLACGSAMCKLEAQRNPDGEPVQVDQVLHGELGWEGQSMAKVDEAAGQVTVYLMRDGIDMPFVESSSRAL